jgi:PEP-CTERM motif
MQLLSSTSTLFGGKQMNTLKTLALTAAIFGAMAVPANAGTKTLMETATIPTAPTPFTYDFTLPAFDTALGTLTGVDLDITSTTTASVQVYNFAGASQTFSNATASIPLTVTGPAGLFVTATYSAGPFSGTAAPGLTTVPGTTGTASNSTSVPSTDFSHYEGSSPIALSYSADAPFGDYGGRGVPGVFFGGSAETGGTFTVVYSYTAVPEPATFAMMGLGFFGLGLAAFRSKHNSAAIA